MSAGDVIQSKDVPDWITTVQEHGKSVASV